MPFRHRTRPQLRSVARRAVRPATDPAFKRGLLEQIRRDMETLRLPRIFHQPSTAFYEERIAAYRDAYRRTA